MINFPSRRKIYFICCYWLLAYFYATPLTDIQQEIKEAIEGQNLIPCLTC